jgi:cytidine deaminase
MKSNTHPFGIHASDANDGELKSRLKQISPQLLKTGTKLWREALKARKNAYAPYSKYKVGAALVDKRGRLVRGTNVESCNFSSICAERVAILKAASEGLRDFSMIAIAVTTPGKVAPCAACLQQMAEFCHPDFLIWVGTTKSLTTVYTFGELLAVPFTPRDLR